MKTLLLVAAFLAALVFIGHRDYEDAVAQDEVYCAMVGDKSWPDYQGTYNLMCKDGKLAQ